MKVPKFRSRPVLLAGLLTLAASVGARQPSACDRGCLQSLADKVLSSMIAHDPSGLNIAKGYKATENAVPAALSMMTLWRTPSSVRHKYYVIDPAAGQLFMVADLAEGDSDELMFGRLKIGEGGAISELELYDSRSRGDVGFQFDARALGALPDAWTVNVPPQRLPSRAALLSAGRSIFDQNVSSPPPSPTCVLMENGKVVEENPAVLKEIMPDGGGLHPALKLNSHGLVSIPCGVPPGRPTDAHARTEIVDEERGIVVSIATVYGVVEPYVITKPTESAFVPDAMLQPYTSMLEKQQASGRYTLPAMQAMSASISVAQMHRIYDGQIQGMHMLQKLGPPDAKSPWVSN